MLLKNNQQPHLFPTQSNKDLDFTFHSFDELKGTEVFVSLKKPTHPNPLKKQPVEQNPYSPLKKHKLTQQNERKTIEHTIKQLLKGKQQLANYLESEKQFIQVLDVHDLQLRNSSQNRGKLASSLTQKKKSRLDTHSTGKNNVHMHFQKVSKTNDKIFIAKNEATTMELMKKQGNSFETNFKPLFQKRQYQTVSFHEICSEEKQESSISKKSNSKARKRQKNMENDENAYPEASKQNCFSGQQCFIMTSPKRRPLKLHENSNYEQKNFYGTKYGLTQFSPWAFPKNEYENELSENSSVLESKPAVNEMVFREKGNNCEAKWIRNQGKTVLKKVQSGIKQNNFKEKIIEDQKQNKRTSDVHDQRRQNSSFQGRYLSLEPKKQKVNESNDHSKVKVVKSSQVMVLQSQNLSPPDIFASKEQAKQMFHPRKSLKLHQSQTKGNSTSIECKIPATKTSLNQNQEEKKCVQAQAENSLQKVVQQGELDDMKKTEEFLKEIILTKNSVSYANSRSISKKQFKQVSQAIFQEKTSNRSNLFMTKNIFEARKKIEKSSEKKEHFSEKDKLKAIQQILDKTEQKSKEIPDEKEFFSAEQENIRQSRSDMKKKAKTSLDNPLSEKVINEFMEKSNPKFLTEESLNGFQMINESKIRNTKNTFVRRKRHSMMVKKKSSEDRRSNEANQRRLSYTSDKEVGMDKIREMNLLEESKGLGIVNPLTKQLYKKYVSIVHSKK